MIGTSLTTPKNWAPDESNKPYGVVLDAWVPKPPLALLNMNEPHVLLQPAMSRAMAYVFAGRSISMPFRVVAALNQESVVKVCESIDAAARCVGCKQRSGCAICIYPGGRVQAAGYQCKKTGKWRSPLPGGLLLRTCQCRCPYIRRYRHCKQSSPKRELRRDRVPK